MTTTNDHSHIESRRALLTGIGGIAAGALLAGRTVHAGPLDPPAGPVTGTGKTLTELEPRTAINATNTPGDADSLFVISQPGSYYLTGNVTGVSGRSGIKVLADGVSLDLMGFRVSGTSGSASGITSGGGSVRRFTIANGAVIGWGSRGIYLAGEDHRLESLHVAGNGGGVLCGNNATVRSCVASGNTGAGMLTGTNALLTDCVATGNTTDGFSCGGGCVISRCVADNNGASTGIGFVVSQLASFTDCTAKSNRSYGFFAGYGSKIRNCTAQSNGGDGFLLGINTTAESCDAAGNGGAGINGDGSNSVSACTTNSNVAAGIDVNVNSTVRGNTCCFNTGPGVLAGGSCRIENNTCISNAHGIRIDSTVSIVFANTCRGNTSNYTIVPNNRVGSIIVPPLSGAISNNSGAAGLGSTDPWANFAF